MSLERLTKSLADRYRIERQLGAGGMATVYLAHDVRHDRKVALKVLRPELSAILGAERFLHEIKTTANLQHPHIVPLHDSGEAEGQVYYVMPYVEGESLRDRLERERQLPVDEALRIAAEVADGLHYAHQHGIVHRDIKPENILLHGGHAQIADFGIALAAAQSTGGHRMTETGMSLGTPHYMSPEQAMGEREITPRSDIYALGVILYEMLTGEPPFNGATAQAVFARVLTEPPRPIALQRHTVPPHVEGAILQALEKLPADRFATAAEFAKALTDTSGTLSGTAHRTRGGMVATKAVPRRRWLMPAAMTVGILVGVAAGMVIWRTPEAAVTRLGIALPEDQRLAPLQTGLRLAISREGRRFVYTGPGEAGTQLWIRDLSQLSATPIPGTGGASSPFFSPDGTKIGYFGRNGFELKVQSLEGGVPLTLVAAGNTSGGGVWGDDGYIYYDAIEGIRRIPENGGVSEIAAGLDSSTQDVGHAYPDITPNARGLITRVRRSGEDPRSYRIVVTDLRSGARRELVQGLAGRYVEPGYLAYITLAGDLLVAPFDQDKLEITGASVPLIQGIATGGLGAADAVISRTGDLLYVAGKVQSALTLATVDRTGRATQIDLGTTGSGVPSLLALSPDGRRVALTMADNRGAQDIWVKDLQGGPITRLTFAGGLNIRPVWSRDGRWVYFARQDSTGQSTLYRVPGGGGSLPTSIGRFNRVMVETEVTPDGRGFILRPLGSQDGATSDIFYWRPGIDSAPVALFPTSEQETGPALSPDGRWLAYTSTGTQSAQQVYVRPFPNALLGQWQVSFEGGSEPRWSRNGRELFYRNSIGELIAVEVRTSPTFAIIAQRALFSSRAYYRNATHFGYEVMPGDQRFVMLPFGGIDERGGDLILVQNWRHEVERALR